MFDLFKALNGRHPTTSLFDEGGKKKRHRLAAEEPQTGVDTSFRAYEHPLVNMAEFKYLGHISMFTYNYCLVVVSNLIKDRKKWAWLSRIFLWEGKDVRAAGLLYKAVVQAFMIFGSETWVVSPPIIRVIG